RLGGDAVLAARRLEARPVALDGADAAVVHEPRVGGEELRHSCVTASSRAAASAPPTAASTARALSSISSCSAAGSDAATIAPPAPMRRPSGAATSVRMTMLR